MSRIILISALKWEGDLILKALKGPEGLKLPFGQAWKGQLAGHEIILAFSGVGPYASSHAGTVVLERFPCKLLINFGIGGAYPGSGLAPGDLALAEEEVFYDLGVRDEGGILRLSIGPGQDPVKAVSLDTGLVLRGFGLLKSAVGQKTLKQGRFVTVSAVSGSLKIAEAVARDTGGILENMEGAPLAWVADLYGVKFLELRGVSNIAGERDKGKWLTAEAASSCQKALLGLIKVLNDV